MSRLARIVAHESTQPEQGCSSPATSSEHGSVRGSANGEWGWPPMTVLMRICDMRKKLHKRYGPRLHWYLWALGVDPQSLARGIGSELPGPVMASARAGGGACSLDTGTERNGVLAEYSYSLQLSLAFRFLGNYPEGLLIGLPMLARARVLVDMLSLYLPAPVLCGTICIGKPSSIYGFIADTCLAT
jgi:hypothetical protein